MTPRHGYTLMEMMLVLVLIIAATAITFPLVGALNSRNKVPNALDQLRTDLVRLRSRAMSDGRTYTFKVYENTGRYKMEPDEQSELAGDGVGDPLIFDGELPEGVIFVRNVQTLVGTATTSIGGNALESWAVFLPDGTSPKDAQIIIGMPGEGARALAVRGLTGAISQSDPFLQEALP